MYSRIYTLSSLLEEWPSFYLSRSAPIESGVVIKGINRGFLRTRRSRMWALIGATGVVEESSNNLDTPRHCWQVCEAVNDGSTTHC